MEKEKHVYRLQGLTCTDCAAKFEKNIRDIDSVDDVVLNFAPKLRTTSCTDCAAKLEKNIRDIDSVDDVVLNVGAAKVTIQGEATIEQLEQAGAFDGIQV